MTVSILIFMGVAFALAFLLRAFRISSFLAFLIAGVVAGPFVLKFWGMDSTWSFLGEIGIIFLWFTMGLELNIKRLWQMRGTIFGFGAAQVLMVATMMFPILWGISGWTILGAVMVCLMLAMSSTSSDLQILAERNELQSSLGRQTFSILLFQDLLAIPLMAMLPLFAGRSLSLGAEVIDILVMSAGLILGVVIFSRLVLNPVMKIIANMKSKEVSLLFVMMLILGLSLAMHFVGLPASIGAFVAGMLLSDTIYRHQVQTDISPYKTLFLAFFFIALGLGLDLNLMYDNLLIILAGAAGLVLLKWGAIFMVARIRNVPPREAFMIALILAQGGEFGLLILQTLKIDGISAIPLASAEILMTIIIISMMMTPVLLALFDRFYLGGREKAKLGPPKRVSDASVLICGFGRVGQTIAKMLEMQNIKYVAVDMNVDSIQRGREHGLNVFYGDTRSEDILRKMGLGRRGMRAVVIALNNDAAQKATARAVRSVAPRVKIFARAKNLAEAEILSREGVRVAMPETIESSFILGGALLESLGATDNRIEDLKSTLRGNNYDELKNFI
ncbi:MAG: cation:proton antiporter [Rickettsiales bacterium]|jgi:Kef-type K+ transport system membrane component KefB|nr:cation:proton antiporter [Rickettsiales bacterium]